MKKNLMKEVKKKKKKLDAKLELHLTRLHALSHEVFAYIYIDFNDVTVFCKCFYFLFLLILE